MSTIKQSLQDDLASATRRVTELFRVQDRLGASTFPVDLLGRDGFFISDYSETLGTLYIHTEDFGKDARELLPIVGKWTKEINEYGEFSMRGNVFGDFNIKLYGSLPGGCKLEIIETEETVPEHVETKRTYKVSGCDPILEDNDEKVRSAAE
jgi:hypothetical protein